MPVNRFEAWTDSIAHLVIPLARMDVMKLLKAPRAAPSGRKFFRFEEVSSLGLLGPRGLIKCCAKICSYKYTYYTIDYG